MMDSRLLRLVELWSKSLESGLDDGAQAELDGLLQDPALTEQLSTWQAQHSPAEALEPGETPGMDKRVRENFRRRVLLRKVGPWALGTALALGGAVFLWQWASADAYTVVAVPNEDGVPAAEAPRAAAAKPLIVPRPTLGLPPGFGSRPTQLQPAIGRTVKLDWTLPAAGQARVRVLDKSGHAVKQLWLGKAQAGSYSSAWDGTDDQGRPLGQGSYRIQAALGSEVIASRDVELLPR